jgi:hypothetical protein
VASRSKKHAGWVAITTLIAALIAVGSSSERRAVLLDWIVSQLSVDSTVQPLFAPPK